MLFLNAKYKLSHFKNKTFLLLLSVFLIKVLSFYPNIVSADKKNKYYIEKIEIVGNIKTSSAFIHRQLTLKEGELLDDEEVVLSRLYLMNLGYFNSVDIRLKKGSKRGNVMVIISLKERGNVVIDHMYLGFNRAADWFGGMGVADTNFLGRGMYLGGAVVSSAHQQGYRLGFFDPEVFGSNKQLGLTLMFNNGREISYDEVDIENANNQSSTLENTKTVREKERLEYRRAGITFTGGRKLGLFYRFLVDYRFEGIDARYFWGEIPEENTELPTELQKGYKWGSTPSTFRSYLSSISFSFEKDTRDNHFLAVSGLHWIINVELGTQLLGSDYEYSKYVMDYNYYLPGIKDHSLRLRFTGGLIQDKDVCPFFNKFFRGDYAFFHPGKYSLPRAMDLNFSEISSEIRYDRFVISMGLDYNIPIWYRGNILYRGFAYFALDLTHTGSIDDKFVPPPSFDLGLKLDTMVGVFTLSVSYVLDVVF